MKWTLGLFVAAAAACAKPEASQPTPRVSAAASGGPQVQSVSVAPQSTGSPNEPVLLVGAPKPPPPPGDVERIKVSDERPDVSWAPPKDRCPEGISEMMAAHLPLGDSMELAPGAAPVLALGAQPDTVEVLFDRTKRVVFVIARKFGLVYVLVEREKRCTFYGVSSGY